MKALLADIAFNIAAYLVMFAEWIDGYHDEPYR